MRTERRVHDTPLALRQRCAGLSATVCTGQDPIQPPQGRPESARGSSSTAQAGTSAEAGLIHGYDEDEVEAPGIWRDAEGEQGFIKHWFSGAPPAARRVGRTSGACAAAGAAGTNTSIFGMKKSSSAGPAK